jgi:hypothetical protein
MEEKRVRIRIKSEEGICNEPVKIIRTRLGCRSVVP